MIKMAGVLIETRSLYEAMHRFDVRAAEALGIHVTDLRCVNALESGPLSAGEIGARLALTSGSVTALINRLLVGGYVTRVEDPEDGRRARVSLTQRFRTEADRVYSILGKEVQGEFGAASTQEQKTCALALARLTKAFAAAADTLDSDV